MCCESNRDSYCRACRRAMKLINESCCVYFHRRFGNCTDCGQQWGVARELRHSADHDMTRTDAENHSRCLTFLEFFLDQIHTLKDTVHHKVTSFLHLTDTPDHSLAHNLTHFTSLPLPRYITSSLKHHLMFSSRDFIPTSLLKSCSSDFSKIISNLANLSISEGKFLSRFKLAQVTPLLK